MNRTFPRALVWLGIPALAGVWLLAVRLVWEQTVWTWDRGAQMVGFSLAHSGLGILLAFASLASVLWPVLVVIAAARARNFGGRTTLLMLAAYALGWALLLAPYGFWQRLFIWKFTPTQSVELATYAAARGDIRTVRAFLDRGVDVNAQSRTGTALHAAALRGRFDVMELLIARGAHVNAINAYGDSPLENATRSEDGTAEARALLVKHGGMRIRGTEEQRDRALEEEVRRDSEPKREPK